MQLHSAWVLLLLLAVPILGYFMLRRRRAAVRFSSLSQIRQCAASARLRLRPLLVIVRLLCLVALIIALARPRKGTMLSQISTEGVAIEIVVDRSGSMQTEMAYGGENLNRFEVVKRVLADFSEGGKKGLGGRENDLIGLITFARYSDTVCPLVHSHNVLQEFLKKTEIVKLRSEDGTAIGDAIALAAARLEKTEDEIQRRNKRLGMDDQAEKKNVEFKIKSKVIILLTDGQSNMGEYDPLAAAQKAGAWGTKIYTIGIGSPEAFTQIQTMMGAFKIPSRQNLDERLLKAIAEETGGFYGRANDAEALREICRKIDKLEKSDVKSVEYVQYAEHFGPWALAGLILLALEMLAGCTIFRKIP